MQTGKTSFNFPSFIEQGSVQLRVSQGELPMLKKGDMLRTFVGQVLQGKAQVIIQGKSITLEGIGKQFQQKSITLKVLQTQPFILLELKNNSKNIKDTQKQHKLSLNIPEKAILSKKITTKMQKDIHQYKAFGVHTTSSLAISLKENKHVLQAIAIAKHGSFTTLQITTHKTPVKTFNNKTQQAQSVLQTLQVTSPARSIQIGERFNIQSVEHTTTSSKLMLEALKPSQVNTNAAPLIHKSSINNLGSLSTGKIITASVGERLPSGNISLYWQQQRFEAPAPMHVRAGDLLQLEVNPDNHRNKPSLRVLEWISQPKSKAAHLLRQHIGKTDSIKQTLNVLQHVSTHISQTQINSPTSSNQPLAQSLSSLQSWIDHYALMPEKDMDGSRIANLIHRLGQHYESSLRQHRHATIQQLQNLTQHDLKALLLQLVDNAGMFKKTVESTQVKRTAERALAHIESQQALNILSMIQADPIRFELPMMVQGQWANVLLSIQQEMYEESREEKHSQASSHHHILFALDLSGLGALRIDAHISDSSVHAKFYHENNHARQFVQENIQQLQEKLKSIGFNDIYLNSAEIKQLSHDTSLQFQQLLNNAPSSDGLLDIQA
ncbi:MAG: flagellar hook-length control protein FliK [Mariprofundaceae bacterium]|nr:flagellar hook-length control protein FliK [Mariprofundaceae bacterium]